MTATDAQVRIMMNERNKGRTQEQAAAKANLRSRKTVAKYERSGRLPSERVERRQYRTRTDVFAEDWPMLETMLRDAPSLEAKALFEWLCEQHPGKYQEGQLRTLQRRIAQWRALHQEQAAVLEQVHRPGEVLQTDGVWLTGLDVTIQGERLAYLLIHSVLPYSNWEWGRVAQSESLNAIRLGVQSTLQQLGAVPQYHQTDNSSAATYRPGADAETGTGGAHVHRGLSAVAQPLRIRTAHHPPALPAGEWRCGKQQRRPEARPRAASTAPRQPRLRQPGRLRSFCPECLEAP